MTTTANHEPMPEIIWTSYLRYCASGRGFDLDLIENILRFSSERYRQQIRFRLKTGRLITNV
ncbi:MULTISPECIES: hypothetical protein [unclassified Nostoc]|uniref:hypothetical protein n=1 Tax=unclassified Nostoc TaxID=2593658 RepID=UPI00262BFCC8|nr:hypothetical protein [Nostoc sp. S13]MDF5738454.1 hypothetical protein [Nostoc sp. S13]